MVMDVTPSPQCVGREFVRQYYTLLNEAPEHLHRFYSHDSSFIHGSDKLKYGEEQPSVIGQSEIHKKIKSLNFKNCHAKIRYVDSQATVNTGVVVQVTGELSNDGQPLRRFMQTFVLALQSANKYYVHNDIFRYQDEVYSDGEEEDDYEPEQQQQQQPECNQNVPEDSHAGQPLPAHPEPVAAAPQPSGDRPAASEPPVLTNGHRSPTRTHETRETRETRREPETELSAPPADEALSWARLVETNERATALAAQSSAQNDADFSSLQGGTGGSSDADFPVDKPSGGSGGRVRQTDPRSDGGEGHHVGKGFATFDGQPPRMDERRMSQQKYSDQQQVFVGNLPHEINDSDMRDLFKDYGHILDIRINKHLPHKAPFGFVVFEDEASAQNVLRMKTVDYNGQKLNIEKKLSRSTSNPRQGGRRDNPRSGYNRGGGRGGYGGGPRDDARNRPDYGQFHRSNKPVPSTYH